MKLEEVDGKKRLVFKGRELNSFPFEGKPVFDIPDTVHITSTVFAKTEAAFEAAVKAAQAHNYDDKITKPEERDKGVYFSLRESHAAECGSCEGIISPRGVRAHGHKCEHCGDATYVEYTRDGAISLQFLKDLERVGRTTLSFRIFGYRENEGKPNELLLFPEPVLGDYAPPRHPKRGWNGLRQGLFAVRDHEEARMILEEARDLYSTETIVDPASGKEIKIMVIKDHTPHMVTAQAVFEAHDIVGQFHNHTSIKVYGGKKYDEFSPLPIPDNFQLSKKYIGKEKHSLAEPRIHETILRAAGQVSRTDFYYQDGRDAFSEIVYKRMTDFVEHFVDIDPQEWAVFLYHAPKDGPGFIHSLASWCSAMSDGQKREVKCEPNIGNALVGISKLAAGKPLTYAESVAMEEGAGTELADKLASHLAEAFSGQIEGEQAALRQRVAKWTQNPDARPQDEEEPPNKLKGGPA